VDYCGVAVAGQHLQLCALREVREAEPPIRLEANFYEPGTVEQVAHQLRSLGEVVVAIAAPARPARDGRERRVCDEELELRGVLPEPLTDAGGGLFEALSDLGVFAPEGEETEGPVAEGAYRGAAVFETNVEGVFCALQERRVPARRHPLGVQRRIEELIGDHVTDPGGDLWHRRIEEIEAAAAGLCAHRYAVGHARWIGDPAEGVVVLPGSGPIERFPTDGVLPPVVRAPLPETG
jgi:predicted nuclease with RNAse H fold